jgi:CelD/BcsL family acetyltransferase involved in cellulose biosynthesis
MLIHGPRGAAAATGWRVVEDHAELDALRGPWNELSRHVVTPTAQHEWASACAHAFHPRGGLNVVVVVREGRLVAVAPLAKVAGSDELEPLGRSGLRHGADFLYADEEALDALAVAVARQHALVRAPRLAPDSPTLAALAGAYAGHGLLSCRPTPGMPTVSLDRNWSVPIGLPCAGERIDVHVTTPGPGDVHRLLDEALAADPAGWQDRRRRRFAQRYAAAMAAAGMLVVGTLRIDGRPAALQLAVERGRRLWLVASATADAAGPRSPAALLALETVLDAAQRGVRACEFLDEGESAAALWAQRSEPQVAARGYPAELAA